MVYEWIARLGALALPDRCELCGDTGRDGLCDGCRADLPWNHHACGHCALPLPPGLVAGDLCRHCRRRAPDFDAVLAPLQYREPVPPLVQAFKYRSRLPLARLLGGVLADAAARRAEYPELLVPTPLHPRRLRERGFNQAAELTRVLAARLQIPWRATQFRRVVDTPSQTGLDGAERHRGLRDAFAWQGAPERRSIAVVDDVITTGATAREMARTLKRAGFARVEIWAVARTPLDGADG